MSGSFLGDGGKFFLLLALDEINLKSMDIDKMDNVKTKRSVCMECNIVIMFLLMNVKCLVHCNHK